MRFTPKYTRGSLTTVDGARIDYVIMGEGSVPMVVIPGANDGLSTVGDSAASLARSYYKRLDKYRLLIIGRREPIPERFGVDRHAMDMLWAVNKLNWGPSVWEGISAGGFIALWAAIKGRNLVRGLILTSTAAYMNEAGRAVAEEWLELVAEERWKDLIWSSISYTCSGWRLWLYRLLRPLLGLFVRPQPYARTRMTRLIQELLRADARSILPYITCPALVIGGEDDRIVPAEAQREMAATLRNARLVLSPGCGHDSDRGNPIYEREVDRFVDEVMVVDN
ncbi:MAG: alpha/beta fold hydrolase [Anaerolineae bacterium]|jgi:3-oxoadipate enol-lactonase